MKVSLSWLQQYVPVNIEIARLTDALTMAGLEVDGVHDRYAFLDDVLVGRIQAVEKHPNADRLVVCEVNVGAQEPLTIVCGAPNAAPGLVVPCACAGAQLPVGINVQATKIRSVASQGMLCSAKELGINPDASGLMELNSTLTVGQPLNQALGLSDYVIEIDLTPNRPDCLSFIGVAREIAALTGNRASLPALDVQEDHTGDQTIDDLAAVEILDPDLCPRYTARLIKDVKIGPSPQWLQDRLLSVGLKPINNIVDITNFVMMETGQPLHAFDYDQLIDQRIVVRRAGTDKQFTTLDNRVRPLEADTLLICDGQKPVALAGIMGGLNSEIEETTQHVLLESAHFNPNSVRKSAKTMGLSTDASHRFERGTDPDGPLYALDRAAQMMVELSQGRLIPGHIDAHPTRIDPQQIPLSVQRLNDRLGTTLTRQQAGDLLQAVNFDVQVVDETALTVTPPSYRVDVTRWEDLSEEVARIWGYNKIETTFPTITSQILGQTSRIRFRESLRDSLLQLGFSETVTYSFIHPAAGDNLRLPEDDARRQTVALLNPISEDQAVLRTSLVPGQLQTLRHNLAAQNQDLRIFEVGNVFYHQGDVDLQPREVEMVTGLMSGMAHGATWTDKTRACDFYDLKGLLEALCDHLNIHGLRYTQLSQVDGPYTLPGHAAAIMAGDTRVGLLGEVHPDTLQAFDIKIKAWIFELELAALQQLVPDTVTATQIPKYPATDRDLTLIVDKKVESAAIINDILKQDPKWMQAVHIMDVYAGEPIAADKKSLTLRMVYQSFDKTLEDEAVNRLHRDLCEGIVDRFNAQLPT